MKIIAEPGSFIAVNALSYIANVSYMPKKEKKKLVYYSLDDGIHDSLAFCALFNKTIECIPLNPRGTSKIHSIIGGQTCDSHDIVCDFDLEELEIGDVVVFYCLRAYSMSITTNFNGFEASIRPIYQLPTDNNEIIIINEEIEVKGIPALWGIPNSWKL